MSQSAYQLTSPSITVTDAYASVLFKLAHLYTLYGIMNATEGARQSLSGASKIFRDVV